MNRITELFEQDLQTFSDTDLKKLGKMYGLPINNNLIKNIAKLHAEQTPVYYTGYMNSLSQETINFKTKNTHSRRNDNLVSIFYKDIISVLGKVHLLYP